MSQHTWGHHGHHDPGCTIFTFSPHWDRAATGKKKKKKIIASMQVGVSLVMSNSATLWTVACQASLSGGSPGKNTGVCWPILAATPF